MNEETGVMPSLEAAAYKRSSRGGKVSLGKRKGGSVAAKFEVTAYSILAPAKISNLCIFEYTYVYSNIHGHFVDDYRIWTPFDATP